MNICVYEGGCILKCSSCLREAKRLNLENEIDAFTAEAGGTEKDIAYCCFCLKSQLYMSKFVYEF